MGQLVDPLLRKTKKPYHPYETFEIRVRAGIELVTFALIKSSPPEYESGELTLRHAVAIVVRFSYHQAEDTVGPSLYWIPRVGVLYLRKKIGVISLPS